jgi:hypothetical protein
MSSALRSLRLLEQAPYVTARALSCSLEGIVCQQSQESSGWPLVLPWAVKREKRLQDPVTERGAPKNLM